MRMFVALARPGHQHSITLILADLSPVEVPTSPKVSKTYPNPGTAHVRIGPILARTPKKNARVSTDDLHAHIVLDRSRLPYSDGPRVFWYALSGESFHPTNACPHK